VGQPYVGEIRMFGGNFAPNGWMFCEGQTLAIAENEVLFQLIGTTYGGDGEQTFNLPNLASRVPIHMGTAPSGTTYQLAEQAGVEQVTLNAQTTPIHNHPFLVSTASAGQSAPAGAMPGNSASLDLYIENVGAVGLNAQAITPTGGSQPHENRQPFLVINFIISLFGVFPSQT
jgi:microcystin-dependent protein